MLQNVGQRIRTIRMQKGISLNEFAKRLNVSSGYLSNLETGKTETIPLSLLETLQKELMILPVESGEKVLSETSLRLNRATKELALLENQNPEAAEYLVSSLEHGINWFLTNKNKN
ncbi:helix-turn-helix transcriptional regulator [Neobacillus cucumis]|nr:helix-turn-helix transcriptional regulator [Neobacillus cucumis]